MPDPLSWLIKTHVWKERGNSKPSTANVKKRRICMKGNWEFLILLVKLFYKLNFFKIKCY